MLNKGHRSLQTRCCLRHVSTRASLYGLFRKGARMFRTTVLSLGDIVFATPVNLSPEEDWLCRVLR